MNRPDAQDWTIFMHALGTIEQALLSASQVDSIPPEFNRTSILMSLGMWAGCIVKNPQVPPSEQAAMASDMITGFNMVLCHRTQEAEQEIQNVIDRADALFRTRAAAPNN